MVDDFIVFWDFKHLGIGFRRREFFYSEDLFPALPIVNDRNEIDRQLRAVPEFSSEVHGLIIAHYAHVVCGRLAVTVRLEPFDVIDA